MTDADHGRKGNCGLNPGKIKNQGTRKKSFSLVPRYALRDITDVTAGFLKKFGIRFLMIDLDNTVAAYDEHVLSEEIIQWIGDIKNNGIELYILSNSTRSKRVEFLSGSADIRFIMRSCKPSPKSLFRAMETAGFCPDESALAGDQVFTDILAANRAGVASIVVQPRRFTNPFLALRYIMELPFRFICKNKVYKNRTTI